MLRVVELQHRLFRVPVPSRVLRGRRTVQSEARPVGGLDSVCRLVAGHTPKTPPSGGLAGGRLWPLPGQWIGKGGLARLPLGRQQRDDVQARAQCTSTCGVWCWSESNRVPKLQEAHSFAFVSVP
jgi:hypothetical protein